MSTGRTYRAYPQASTLATASMVLGLLGIFFFWAMFFGLVLSAAGLLCGGVAWAMSAARTAPRSRHVVVGVLVSLAALVLNVIFLTGGAAYLVNQVWHGY